MEISAESWKIMRRAGELIASSEAGGAGLVVDYGADQHFGQSFRVCSPASPSLDPLTQTGIQESQNCRCL